ncbi:MAG: PAS domain S-box protein [Chloroflexaceae bacterium]|nr:PAS domain S-box protein [Chloroflexaceae bacterium]
MGVTIEQVQAENASLRQRVEELERAESQLQAGETWSRQLLSALFDGIVVLEQGIIIQANPSAARMFGYPNDALIGMNALDLATPESRDIAWQHMVSGSEAMYEAMLLRKDGTTFPAEVQGRMLIEQGRGRALRIVTARDITERRQAEAERVALQQQVIDAQQAALRELSAPLLPISDHTVLMPLIGSIDAQRAQQVMETLLDGVARYRARVAILDITGVQVVDTQVANALIQATQAVKLLGTQVVLTGIGPAMAQTLVHLGADLTGMITCGSLQYAIARTLERRSSL